MCMCECTFYIKSVKLVLEALNVMGKPDDEEEEMESVI